MVFFFNYLPMLILVNGEKDFHRLLILIFNFLAILYLESIFRFRHFNNSLVFVFFLIIIIYGKPFHDEPSQYLKTLSDKFDLSVVSFTVMKSCSAHAIGFMIFALYAVYRENLSSARKTLKLALDYDRYYESGEDIQQ